LRSLSRQEASVHEQSRHHYEVEPRRSRVGARGALAGALRATDVLVAGALLAFLGAVLWPTWREAPVGRIVAWLSASAVILALIAYPRVHPRRRRHGLRDLQRELAFDVRSSRKSRGLGGRRRSTESWHGGHGHSGERPQFD
jgi:hypothetical protein